jgi:hypothetical protein
MLEGLQRIAVTVDDTQLTIYHLLYLVGCHLVGYLYQGSELFR